MSLFLLKELTKASPDAFYDFVLVVPDKKNAIVSILFASLADPKVRQQPLPILTHCRQLRDAGLDLLNEIVTFMHTRRSRGIAKATSDPCAKSHACR